MTMTQPVRKLTLTIHVIFGIVLVMLLLMLAAMSLLGGHGPGAHIA